MRTSFEIKVICAQCKQPTAGTLWFDQEMRLVATDGGMLFGDGWRCFDCLDQPWASSDFTVDLGAPS